MEKKTEYYSNPLEDSIIKEEERKRIEARALQKLSEKQIKVLELRYGICGEAMSILEIAKMFGVTPTRIREIEKKALKCLATIILTEQNKVIDSKSGMTTFDLYRIANDIAEEFIRHNQQRYNHKNCGVITQSIQDIILWRLSTEERQTLLHQFSRFSIENWRDWREQKQAIHEKIFAQLLADDVVCKKAYIKK